MKFENPEVGQSQPEVTGSLLYAWLEQKKLNKSLEEKIVARTAELEASQERLQQLSQQTKRAEQRERKRLAGGLHDEVQQLLVAARMSLEPFAEEFPQLQKAYDCLGRALKTTRTLIFDLFPVILYTEGLEAAIRDLCGRMQEEHGLEVAVTDRAMGELDEDLRVDLYHAVRELLFNVVKHADVKEAEVNLEKTDRALLITVRDQGRGFDTGSQYKSGYGLLSLEKRVREHGGAVDISSAEGEGTQVRLTVPLESGSLKVLIVDDHELVREALAILLATEGFQIVGDAQDGRQALTLFEEHLPDIVLMDVRMPEMSGPEVTRKILEQAPGTRVVGLSMHESRDVEQEMLDAGARFYFRKDRSWRELIHPLKALPNH